VADTNRNRTVIARTYYTPYGEAQNRTVDGPGYTSHVADGNTGLVYMQQRYYDPVVGRFLSRDPVGVSAASGGNFNRYWYANNNPYTYTDPDGRAATAAVFGALQADVAVPEPSDAAWPKWVGWGIAIAGAAAIDYVVLNESGESTGPVEVKPGDAFPDRSLPRAGGGEPAPDPEAEGPHTQLGTKEGRNGPYPQAREFDAEGRPVRDIDFTDHGRPGQHNNPHEHPYRDNPTGGTRQRGPEQPLRREPEPN
jgi:RHS repeat-associated protein